MSVRSALCLLVVLTCCRDISAQAGIGSACKKSEECNAVNDAACMNGVCACLDSHVADPSSKTCISKVNHGETCSESIQCSYSNETECVSNKCRCKSNFNYNGKRCVGNLGLGQKCERDSECVVSNDLKQETVWCHGSLCVCKQGFKIDGDRCVIGGDCITDTDCNHLAESVCDQRLRDRAKCVCKEGYIPVGNNTKCLPIAHEIGSGCEYDEQCSPKFLKAVCTNNQCRCAAGTSLKADNTCVIGGDCLEDADCSKIEDSYCDKKVWDKYLCACNDSFVLVGKNTKCLPIAHEIGSGCEYDEQCSYKLGKAVCTNNQCRCAAGISLKADNTCVIGDCLEDADCSKIEDSYCDKKVWDKSQCACRDGFILVGKKTTCLPIAHEIGSGCKYDEQCSYKLGKAVCTNNQCRCAAGTSLKADNTCGAAVTAVLSLSCFVLIWVVKLL